MVLKLRWFTCTALQIQRNCRALKLHIVLEDVVVGLMNKTNNLFFNILRLWRRVKLHGSQTLE